MAFSRLCPNIYPLHLFCLLLCISQCSSYRSTLHVSSQELIKQTRTNNVETDKAETVKRRKTNVTCNSAWECFAKYLHGKVQECRPYSIKGKVLFRLNTILECRYKSLLGRVKPSALFTYTKHLQQSLLSGRQCLLRGRGSLFP